MGVFPEEEIEGGVANSGMVNPLKTPKNNNLWIKSYKEDKQGTR